MKRLMTATALATGVAFAGVAFAAGSAQAVDLTIVSWGGAYTASQQKAYHDPYMAANPGVTIINDDNAAEGLAKVRAQVESNNVTWDIVDMVAADAITACDEGLIMEIDPDTWLAPAPDGTPASEDFFAGTLTPGGTNCFIPQIVYSTTFGYRTDVFEGEQPSSIADVFDLEKVPRQALAGEEAHQQPRVGPARRRRRARGRLSHAEHGRGRGARAGEARHHQGPGGVVVQGGAAAAAAGGRRGRHRLGLQRPALLGHRREGPAHRHDVGSAGVRSRRLGGAGRGPGPRRGEGSTSTSPPTPSGSPTRRSSSPTVRRAIRRRRWSATMPTSAST